MSFLSEEAIDSILERSTLAPLTPKTLTDKAQIKLKVAEARSLNYGLSLEESLLGEIAIGSAILDRRNQPVAAVHIAGSLSEWTSESFTQRFAPLVIEAARALGRA